MGSINDSVYSSLFFFLTGLHFFHLLFFDYSVYSSLFFFLTGLHFFHLLVGLFLFVFLFWGCSFPSKRKYFLSLRVSEVHLFYNLQLFYWHFLEFLWFFIFLVFYRF